MNKIKLASILTKLAKEMLATGEMSRRDIQPGGEHYEWAMDIEKAARTIQHLTKDAIKFQDICPFDAYQGPYAQMSSFCKLWSGDEGEGYVLQCGFLQPRKNLVGTTDQIATKLLNLIKVEKLVKG